MGDEEQGDEEHGYGDHGLQVRQQVHREVPDGVGLGQADDHGADDGQTQVAETADDGRRVAVDDEDRQVELVEVREPGARDDDAGQGGEEGAQHPAQLRCAGGAGTRSGR